MPIANCYVLSGSVLKDEDIVGAWSAESGVSGEHMTVNVIEIAKQVGNSYRIMVTLLLPTVWSRSDVSALQLSLAKALARCYRVPIEEVFVVTSLVNSGFVVEAGEAVTWPELTSEEQRPF